MDPIIGKDQHHDDEYTSYQWDGLEHYHSPQLPSGAHEYTAGYSYMQQTLQHAVPIEPAYSRHIAPLFTVPQAHQPVYQAQWPSMITNPPNNIAPPLPAGPALAPVTAYASNQARLPIVAQPPRPTAGTSSRRTLTDQDRRRMCLYHEQNPSVKQTEIGAMFGVERSTVSKVLRQKEKYLVPDDGSRSPIKRSKGKFPDIERALSNWARNHQRQGLPLSDAIIRDKARFFAQTVGSNESHVKLNSNSWLEKFKQKNYLLGAKPRKASIAGSHSGLQSPTEISPVSPTGLTSPLSPIRSHDDLKTTSPDSYIDFSASYRHVHSQSTTSLTSGYSDVAQPQDPSGSFHSPDLNTNDGTFITLQQPRPPGGTTAHRPRSSTFPMLGLEATLATTPRAPDNGHTPRQYEDAMTGQILGSPAGEVQQAPLSLQTANLQHSSSNNNSAVHSAVHSPVLQRLSPKNMGPPSSLAMTPPATIREQASPTSTPSQDEARRALELVMNFFQAQPTGLVDPQEYIMMGKLMEKLKVQGQMGELPGGMHSIDGGANTNISRTRSIHSL
jgi:hypothetical protein